MQQCITVFLIETSCGTLKVQFVLHTTIFNQEIFFGLRTKANHLLLLILNTVPTTIGKAVF